MKIPYRCDFCSKRLCTSEFQGLDYLRVLVGLRPYHCPHCFGWKTRPFAIIGWLFLFWRRRD